MFCTIVIAQRDGFCQKTQLFGFLVRKKKRYAESKISISGKLIICGGRGGGGGGRVGKRNRKGKKL